MEIAAVIAAVSLATIAVFQLALALGAPLGRAAWSGQHPGVLPVRLRLASAVAALVYPLIIALVLSSAGLVGSGPGPGGPVVMWVLVGFFALGTLANAVSRSKPERIWAPVSLTISACCAVIATGI